MSGNNMHASDKEMDNPSAPLYITIGPPKCGKTTWLKQQQQQQAVGGTDTLLDIALDDQPNVYLPVPLDVFIAPVESFQTPTEHFPPQYQQLLKQSFYKKTVQDRVLSVDNREQRWVLQRLAGKMSRKELEDSMRSILCSEEDTALVQTLVKSVENLLDDSTATSKVPILVDLFIVEALFQADPSRHMNQTGIERASDLLVQTPEHIPVAYGNTNTKPRDYVAALEVAEKHRRPVVFCVYGTSSSSSSNQLHDAALFDLPHLEFQELMDRNIRFLIQTGRYVPVKKIWEMCQRTEKLINDVLRQVTQYKGQNNYVPSKLDMHRQLARLAQFDMQQDRTVKKLEPKRDNWSSRWQPQNNHNHNHNYNRTTRDQALWNSSAESQQQGQRREPERDWERNRGGVAGRYGGRGRAGYNPYHEPRWSQPHRSSDHDRPRNDRVAGRNEGRNHGMYSHSNQRGWSQTHGDSNHRGSGYKRPKSDDGEGNHNDRPKPSQNSSDGPLGSKRQHSAGSG